MKFCKHCGTEVSEESMFCPSCKASLKGKTEAEATNQKLSKKINRMIIVMPLVVILTAAVTFALTYFLLPQRIADAMGSSDSNSVKTSVNSTESRTDVVAADNECPENEYGNHDWDAATCVEPAKCFDCGEYKNDILGNHSYFTTTDGRLVCIFCYAEK